MKLRLGGLQELADKAKKPVFAGRAYTFVARSIQKEIPNEYQLAIGSGAYAARFTTPIVHRVEVSIPFSGAMYDTISEWMWSGERATVTLQPVDFSTSFVAFGATVEQMHTETGSDNMALESIKMTLSYSTWTFTHEA